MTRVQTPLAVTVPAPEAEIRLQLRRARLPMQTSCSQTPLILLLRVGITMLTCCTRSQWPPHRAILALQLLPQATPRRMRLLRWRLPLLSRSRQPHRETTCSIFI